MLEIRDGNAMTRKAGPPVGGRGNKLQRIVVISDDSVASGGAASIALASLRHLSRRGLPVTLLSGDEGSNPDLVRWGIDVVSLGGRHIIDGPRAVSAVNGLYDRTVCKSLSRWISLNDSPGTVYHLHNWHKFLSPSAFVPLRQVADRLIVSAHDYFLACPNGGYFHFPNQSICNLTPMSPACLAANCDKRHYGHKLWRVARHVMRQSLFRLRDTPSTMLAVHEGMLPFLERGGVDRKAIQVLRNPVTPWCSARVIAERNRAVVFVGRLELDKGADTLARATSNIQAPLKVIGDGPLAPAIRRMHPGAELLGRLSHSAVAELAKTARMVVLPTRVCETFGLVALEAAMSGIPVISSSSALITEELVGLGCGLACQADDHIGLSRQIDALLRDDATVASMSRRGFEAARHLAPTEDEWCSSLLQLYESKLSGTGVCQVLKRSPMSEAAVLLSRDSLVGQRMGSAGCVDGGDFHL
jgi:glycosyltransferase involved in cell wall biosynthesis